MLYRKVNTEFEAWFKGANKKALFVQGARQVGKTTTIREFCRSHYENFIELNFIKKPAVKKAFAGDLDADTIILNLSAMGYGPFVKDKTVIFLDEIQECSDARTAIKFLVEDGSYDYIESGPLLGINYKNSEDETEESDEGDIASVPVGYEDTLDMYPLDFEEFLLACQIPQQVVDTLRRAFDTGKAVPEFIHEQVMERFRQYLVVGGLPKL